MTFPATNLSFLGTSFFRLPKSLLNLFSFSKTLPKPSIPLRLVGSYSSAASLSLNLPVTHHPWPEWVSFVDRLMSNGYFPTVSTEEESKIKDLMYTDYKILKDPCISFARDRFDIFNSLSKEHIQTVVEAGCPTILRKSVNSAKRLRVFLGLDEGDVCGACNLRKSCDSAYLLVKESELAPRTVDIVRILLYYAIDPLVVSGERKPPGRDLVEESTKKLLCELIDLSDASPTPPPPSQLVSTKASTKRELASTKKDPFDYWNSEQSKNGEPSEDVEMKKGDWMCSKCNFMNFSRNIQCLKCQEFGPRKIGRKSDMGNNIEMKTGDWICAECSYMNFARNKVCLKCEVPAPKRANEGNVEFKKGDWNCPKCDFMNFAMKKNCMRCQEERPKRVLLPGDWECPSCDFVNFRKNAVCRKCNCKMP